MSEIGDSDIVFDGVNGLASDAFLRIIRRRVLAQGIHKDDELVAETAASCLGGSALDWYEDQPSEVQGDWKLLRRAILIRWPSSSSGVPSSTLVESPISPPPSSNIPTPAAAPPMNNQLPTSKKGYIRVLTENPAISGYLSQALSKDGTHYCAKTSAEAIIVQITPVGRSHDIQALSSASGGPLTTLGLTWCWKNSQQELRKKETTWGTIANLSGPPRSKDPTTSSTRYHGHSSSDIWTLTMEGLITLAWEVDPGVRHDLHLALSHKSWGIDATNNYEDYANDGGTWTGPPKWTRAELRFEPIV